MVSNINISDNLKEFFEIKKMDNITASRIANDLGISKKTLSNYINGDAYIPLIHLNKLANLFNVSIDYLLGLSNLENYENNKQIEKLDSDLIGKNLKTVRKELKISQEKIANLIGVNKSSISRYENGESLILTICLYTFCKEYQISADYLLGNSENKYISKKQ